jgi:hypothetical protein
MSADPRILALSGDQTAMGFPAANRRDEYS